MLKIDGKSIYKQLKKYLRLKQGKVSNSQMKEQFCHQLSRIIKFKCLGQVEICETSLINLSNWGQMRRKRTMKRRNATYKGFKVRQWQTERKEQLHPIRDKDRNNLKPKMQSDKDIYISTGQILNQNFQESQKKMQKHIYCV